MKTEIEYWKYIYYNGEKTNYWISTKGRVINHKTEKFIKPFISNSGYYRVRIRLNDHSEKKFSIHRLVAIAFIPLPKKYLNLGMDYKDLVPNHKDGNKLHNDCYNLEWMTNKENTIDAVLTGLCGYIGENSHLAKMNKKTAIKCCEMLSKGMRSGDIANQLGITKKSVLHIKNRECWKSISKDYEFPKLGLAIPYTIPDDDIHEICKMIVSKKYIDKEIALKFNVSREYIRDIRNGKRKTKISNLYFTSN